MSKNSLFSTVLILISMSIFATTGFSQIKQESKIDSLRLELKNKEKISTQLELALAIFKKNNQEAQELAKSALTTSLKTKNKSQEMRSYYVLGTITNSFDSIMKSQIHYDKALQLSEEIGENWYRGKILYSKGQNYVYTRDYIKAIESFNRSIEISHLTKNFKNIGSAYSMMGNIFRMNAIYDRAIEYFIKAGINYKKANFIEGDAWISYLLGRVYADLKNPTKALEYFQESLNNYQVISKNDGNKNGLAICYEQIALLNLEFENLEVALKNINSLFEIRFEEKSKVGISNAYSLMGRIDFLKGNYEDAELHFNKSLEIKTETKDLIGLPIIYEYLGLCQIERGNFDEGFNQINRGLELAISNNQKKIQLEIYSKLSEVYLNFNYLEKAVYSQKKLIEIQNDIFFGVAGIKMEQLQMFYELDENKQQLIALENQNKFNELKIKQQRNSNLMLALGILITILSTMTISIFYKKLRHKNNELEASNITKNKLFSIIAHDLRGPIGTVNELLRILLDATKNKDIKKVEKFVPVIHESMNETYNLLDNLLQWANSQSKRINIKPEILPLSKIVHNTLKSISSQAERKNIAINVDIDKNINVTADLMMLKTIILNLATNAIKFTNEHGKISINAVQKNNLIQICVKDSGIGISSDAVKVLFSINTNFSKKGTAGEKGTGLGLILCKDFVKLHKGEIWVESVLNEGSSFYFTLPN